MNLNEKRFAQYAAFKSGLSHDLPENKSQQEQLTEIPVSPDPISIEPKHPSLLSFIRSSAEFVKNCLCFTGVWICPFLSFAGLSFHLYRQIYFLLLLFIMMGNASMYSAGKRRFTFADAFNVLSLSENIWKFEEQQQKNPPLQKKLLLKTGGVYFGKKEGKDVGKNISADGHVIVFGGSGSGKSSCIAIPSLNTYHGGVFCIDIKDGGELRQKSTPSFHPVIHILQPGNKDSMGYDPYLFVNKHNPEAGIKEIAYALIPTNVKNPADFWTMNEQRYLMAALYFCYASGQTFIESCRTIYALSEKELLEKIRKSDCRFAREGMSDFYNMAEETLSGIVAGVGNAITTFVTDKDILDIFSKSTVITPQHLLMGQRIFVCIPEHKLDVYKEVLQLIISQFLRWFEQLPVDKTQPVLFVLDEFARLGRYDRLINGLATLRSKKVTIMILTQSVSQLDSIYGSENRKVMIDNCAYRIILNASDADSQTYFSKIVGTYNVHQRSYTRGKNNSCSISIQNLPIIKPEDFTTLHEIILLSPYGLQRIKKHPYYKFYDKSKAKFFH